MKSSTFLHLPHLFTYLLQGGYSYHNNTGVNAFAVKNAGMHWDFAFS